MITPRPIRVCLAHHRVPPQAEHGMASMLPDQERPLLLGSYLKLLDRDLARPPVRPGRPRARVGPLCEVVLGRGQGNI
jgi:hypothetical protein